MNAAASSGGSGGTNADNNFVIQQTVSKETDSAMLNAMQELSQNNAVVGPVPSGPVEQDAPVVTCLTKTVEERQPPGIIYVLYTRQSIGKTSAARYFCKVALERNNNHRSILITGTGGGYHSACFERIAANLNVDFTSNWVRCLIAAMKCRPSEAQIPFLFLDEFNQANERDLGDMHLFMRQCQGQNFHLIVMTSKKDVADSLVGLNAWAKVRPLQSVHNGPNNNIPNTTHYEPDRVLQKVIILHHAELLKKEPGLFDDYSFLIEGMSPTDALAAAQQHKLKKVAPLANFSDMPNLLE